MNFCVTDGVSVVATRYVSSRNDAAASLVCSLLPFLRSRVSIEFCSGFRRGRLSVNMQRAVITRCPRQTSAKISYWLVFIRFVEQTITKSSSDRKRASYLRERYLLNEHNVCRLPS